MYIFIYRVIVKPQFYNTSCSPNSSLKIMWILIYDNSTGFVDTKNTCVLGFLAKERTSYFGPKRKK